MKPTASVAFWTAILAVTLALGWMIFYPGEPRYHGKRLSQWLEELVVWEERKKVRESATQAIRQIGTNAVPFLVRDLQRRDSPLKLALMQWVSRQPFFRLPWTSSAMRHRRAIEGCRQLGPAAAGAIPALIQDLESREFGNEASLALAAIGPEAVPAMTNVLAGSSARARCFVVGVMGHFFTNRSESTVPALLACLDDPNNVIRYRAVEALRYVGMGQETVVVPAILPCAKDQDSSVRWHAMLTLSGFHGMAKLTIPAINDALQDPDKSVRGQAALTVIALDFERARLTPGVLGALTENLQNDQHGLAAACALALKRLDIEGVTKEGVQ